MTFRVFLGAVGLIVMLKVGMGVWGVSVTGIGAGVGIIVASVPGAEVGEVVVSDGIVEVKLATAVGVV